MTEAILKNIGRLQKRLAKAKENNNRAEERRAYSDLGNVYYSLGDFQKAIEYHKQDLSIAKELGVKHGEGRAYGNLGNAYDSLGDFQRAMEYHKQHLSISKELGIKDEEGAAYGNLGNVYYSLGDFQKAIEYHKQDLSIAKELGVKEGEGRAYGNLGNAYDSLGDFQTAIEYHKQHLSIAKELGIREGEGCAYCNLGVAYYSLGDFQRAIEYHKQDLSISKELGVKDGEGAAYGNLGNVYYSLGDFQKAIEYHKQDLSIAKELGVKEGEGRAYGNLGNAYDSLGDFQRAVEYHKQHLSIAKELGIREGEGRAYGNLGNAYYSLGDFQRAIEYYKQDLSIAKELGVKDGEGAAYGNLGNVYNSLGDFQKAIEYHKQHLSIAKELGVKDGEGAAYGHLGNAYDSLGDFQRAIEYHKQHVSIAKELGIREGEGRAYCNLGNAYHSLGDFQRAIEYGNQSLSICKELGVKEGEGRAYCNLGNVYDSLGDFQRAIEYHKQYLSIAKELGAKNEEGCAYGNLGNAYCFLGDFQRAIEYHKQHLSIAKELGAKVGEGQAYFNLGLSLLASGSLNESLAQLRSSVETYDNIRANSISEDVDKISFRELSEKAYAYFIKVLISLHRTDEALYVAERGRAQALLDALKINYGFTSFSQGANESRVVVDHISRNTSVQTVFFALQNETINVWVFGEEGTAIFRQVEITNSDAQENSFIVLLESTLKNIGAGVDVRCENRSLDELCDHSTSRTGDAASLSEPLYNHISCFQKLYDAVFSSIEDLLHSDELIVVPDGPLFLVPWGALSETLRIRTVPSLTSLKLITECPREYHNKSGALLIGDPCLKKICKKGKPIYKQLHYAKQEVEMIGKILKSQPLTGEDATKQEVLSRIASVALVHIAAHGNKATGEIALSPNPTCKSKISEEDYILTMSDIQSVKLRARLVVLSCCHSGKGEVKSEGVVGMARAFLWAGARSVLVSLWAIDDEATMEFMKSFYQHLKDGDRACIALHKAMECFRDSDRFSPPKYWAPFVLIGDDVTIEFDENH